MKTVAMVCSAVEGEGMLIWAVQSNVVVCFHVTQEGGFLANIMVHLLCLVTVSPLFLGSGQLTLDQIVKLAGADLKSYTAYTKTLTRHPGARITAYFNISSLVALDIDEYMNSWTGI